MKQQTGKLDKKEKVTAFLFIPAALDRFHRFYFNQFGYFDGI